jgi:hypothetical protein
MSRWFRFYDDVIDDPKILKLPEDVRWHWVALLCVASKHGGSCLAWRTVSILLRLPSKGKRDRDAAHELPGCSTKLKRVSAS